MGLLALAFTLVSFVAFAPSKYKAPSEPQFSRENCPLRGKHSHPEYPSAYKVKSVPTEWGSAGLMMPAVVIKADYYATCSACGCDELVPRHDSPHP